MGMNIRLFPRDLTSPSDIFRSEVCFELNKWVDTDHILSVVREHAEPFTKAVMVPWVSKPELRHIDDIDPGHTWLVKAIVLKPLVFDHEDWPSNVRAYHKAIESFIWELPDDWHVVVYYI